MRKKIVAGNWKMNTTCQEGMELAKAVVAKAGEAPANVGLIVAAPFTHLCCLSEILEGIYRRGFRFNAQVCRLPVDHPWSL